MTNLGIRAAVSELTSLRNGERPDANKAMIILTDGHSTEARATKTDADCAHKYVLAVLCMIIYDSLVCDNHVYVIPTKNV